MEPRTTLPLDILLYIIELLASSGDDEDIKSLHILSRSCKSMVPLCRKHLFSSLRLRSKLDSDRFSDLLSKIPDIACYVRSLDYSAYNPITDRELNILDMLKERSSLRSIELWSPNLDWNDFPETIRSSLVSLIQLPTVTHLDIYSFEGFPAMALSGCSNLIKLGLRELELVPPEVDQVISRSKIPTPVSLYCCTVECGLAARTLLNSASLHAGGPIVDFSLLLSAGFDVGFGGDIDHVNELIKVTTRLEYLFITMQEPVNLAGLGASLAINAHRMLKLLELGIRVGDDYDPLCGLSRELRFIAGNNILEHLALDVVIPNNYSYPNDPEDWSVFDSVLTESGAFPMLHRVSVDISWHSGRDLIEQDAMLEILKEDKFPRLVESKEVQFNFCAEVQYDNDPDYYSCAPKMMSLSVFSHGCAHILQDRSRNMIAKQWCRTDEKVNIVRI